MLQLFHDIKTLIVGPPSSIPKKVPYVPTSDWEKERVNMTLQQLEDRVDALERVRHEIRHVNE